MLTDTPAPWMRPLGEKVCAVHGTDNEGVRGVGMPTCVLCAAEHLDAKFGPLGDPLRRPSPPALDTMTLAKMARHRAQCDDPRCACRDWPV